MTLEHLRRLHDDFSDEIPNNVLHGRGNFKVRRNWWQGVVGDLDLLRTHGQIPPELQGEVDSFLDHYTSDEFHAQPLTTSEDLGVVNNLLSKIIGIKR
jgi:hypothetical protein